MDIEQIKAIVHQMLNDGLRVGTGIDFHSLHEGCPLILAGVNVPHDKGFHVRRSDGDPVSHAIVDALLSAFGAGDIADWFSDKDGVTNAQSIDYLDDIYKKLIVPRRFAILQVQIHILADEPKLKPYFPQMRQEIGNRLKMDPQRVSIQGKTFEGKGVIGRQEGIETHAIVALLQASPSNSPHEL